MPGPEGYGEAVPHVRKYLAKYERALERVRESHAGRPIDEVRSALARAFEAERLEVWNEVVEDAARLISEGADGGSD